ASIDPAELTDEIFVNPPTVFELAFWDDTRAIAALGNFIPKVEKRTHDMIMSLAYVAAGYGIAIVAKSFETIGIPNIGFRDFKPAAARISTVAFAYRPNNSSPAVKMLVSFMRRFALEKSTSSKAVGLPEGRLGGI